MRLLPGVACPRQRNFFAVSLVHFSYLVMQNYHFVNFVAVVRSTSPTSITVSFKAVERLSIAVRADGPFAGHLALHFKDFRKRIAGVQYRFYLHWLLIS